jgi:prepilin-type N-terminal cleavage/methylation domain-containing protein
MKKSTRGFSLIELLIVVAIILIIAAIAIPNLLRSKIAANQASCVGSLRTINTAEITYASTYNSGYSQTLSYLGPSSGNPVSTAAGLIPSDLALVGIHSGYGFQYSSATTDASGRINGYTVLGTPVSSATGTNYYFTDQSGVIRQNTTSVAGSTDSVIGG